MVAFRVVEQILLTSERHEQRQGDERFLEMDQIQRSRSNRRGCPAFDSGIDGPLL